MGLPPQHSVRTQGGQDCDAPSRAWLGTAIEQRLVLFLHWSNFSLFLLILGFMCLPLSLFLNSSIWKKHCTAMPTETRKRPLAHFCWLTHLVCKWQLLPQKETFSIQEAFPPRSPCQRVKITLFASHRGGALAVGPAHIQRETEN